MFRIFLLLPLLGWLRCLVFDGWSLALAPFLLPGVLVGGPCVYWAAAAERLVEDLVECAFESDVSLICSLGLMRSTDYEAVSWKRLA